jgi:metal-responsive CopG/Arc/MetJ family transcriptional regulator
MRKKLLDEDKKPKISITIDKELDSILEEYLEKNKISRSKYIENLIREDFQKKGKNTEREF